MATQASEDDSANTDSRHQNIEVIVGSEFPPTDDCATWYAKQGSELTKEQRRFLDGRRETLQKELENLSSEKLRLRAYKRIKLDKAFRRYSTMPYLKTSESACLLLDIDPWDLNDRELFEELLNDVEFVEIREFIRRAIDTGGLLERYTALDLLKWSSNYEATRAPMSFRWIVLGIAAEGPRPSIDLASSTSRSSRQALSAIARTANSQIKVILGIAKAHYELSDKDGISKSASGIEKDLKKHKLSVDRKTIKKYLQDAWEIEEERN